MRETVALPSERKEITVSPETLRLYAGVYNLDQMAPNDRMMITGQERSPLYPESETKLFLKVADATVEFLEDDKGAVTPAILRQGINETKAPRVSDKAGGE